MNRITILGSSLVVAVAATVLLAGPSAPAASAQEVVERSFGPERIATAVAASRDHRATSEHALLATAASFPDALSAVALAARLDAPLLLTQFDQVPAVVADELARLGVRTVWVLGGAAAVSPAVDGELTARGYEVRRLSGSSRYETAGAVALAAGPSRTGEAVVALGAHPDGTRAWPDAVAAGALAASPDRLPILLTRHDRLPPETADALTELGARHVVLVGGTGSVSEQVEAELRARGFQVRRIAGASRYETSVALAADALARTPVTAQDTVIFASGAGFADALSAGALAAELTGPLLLVPPTDLAASVDGFLRGHHERLDRGVLVGGSSAASDLVADQIQAALLNQPAPERDVVVGVIEGSASWYGPGFHGRTTASGEVFDRYALTAAHRTLPFGTRLRVTNTANGSQVEVRVNDRGPYHGGRILDLSEAAAAHIGLIATGTGWVRAEILQ